MFTDFTDEEMWFHEQGTRSGVLDVATGLWPVVWL
jgi:hypothetical protein